MTGPRPAIVFVTQAIDEDDPVLGFTTSLVRALARRTDVAVIANEVHGQPSGLGAEVVSLGKERGAPRWRMAARYEASVAWQCRRLRPAALFAHMCPPFLTRAAPATKLTRTPAILWYAHLSDTPGLRVAERLADAVATSLPTSYPRASPKVHSIGQAIDTDRFSVRSQVARAGGRLDLLALGRCSVQKDYAVILRAVAAARARGVDARLRIEGPGVQAGLRNQVADLGLDDWVTLGDGVPPAAVPDLLAHATALVNATRGGSTDKAVFEAMACGRPAIASSPTFRDLLDGLPLDLRFPGGDYAALAERIAAVAAADDLTLRTTAALGRERIVAHHSVEHWADEVLALAAALIAGSRTGSASRAALR